MKLLKPNENGFTPPVDNQQAGFIPMMLTLLAILIAIVVVVYLRVLQANK